MKYGKMNDSTTNMTISDFVISFIHLSLADSTIDYILANDIIA